MQFIGIKIANSIKNLFLGLAVALLLFSNSSTALALSNQLGSDPTGKSQRSIIEKKPWLDPTACAGAPAARPGHSNHQMGLAVDLTYSGSLITAIRSTGFKWLAANSGFYRLCCFCPEEPWHWSVGGG